MKTEQKIINKLERSKNLYIATNGESSFHFLSGSLRCVLCSSGGKKKNHPSENHVLVQRNILSRSRNGEHGIDSSKL